MKEEYLNRIYIISNEEESALEKFNSGLSSKEYGDILYSLYQKYDLVLNEIYNDLEIYLPSEKIKILKDEKIKWISEKEEKLNIEHSDLEDNLSYIEVNEMLCSLTKERCYELIECIE
ncbi:lysozyme inhibitor LprI family protein [Romboutsia sp. Marseille-P6047]|uniref:lysozyme inhibitor LprI family protein n=1 Tax=Romboutsia sp. Marseille-P6047 TaxID=2161817 RepID=UPI003FA726F2